MKRDYAHAHPAAHVDRRRVAPAMGTSHTGFGCICLYDIGKTIARLYTLISSVSSTVVNVFFLSVLSVLGFNRICRCNKMCSPGIFTRNRALHAHKSSITLVVSTDNPLGPYDH